MDPDLQQCTFLAFLSIELFVAFLEIEVSLIIIE